LLIRRLSTNASRSNDAHVGLLEGTSRASWVLARREVDERKKRVRARRWEWRRYCEGKSGLVEDERRGKAEGRTGARKEEGSRWEETNREEDVGKVVVDSRVEASKADGGARLAKTVEDDLLRAHDFEQSCEEKEECQ
jgi:hypothetical protein